LVVQILQQFLDADRDSRRGAGGPRTGPAEDADELVMGPGESKE